MDKNLKKKALEFSAFITDIAKVMQKHKVDDALVMFYMNEEFRNTYIPLTEEKELFCEISDGVNSDLLEGGRFNKSRISEVPKTKSQKPRTLN